MYFVISDVSIIDKQLDESMNS